MQPARSHHHAHQPPIMSVNKSDSATPDPFPFFQVLRYFKAYCREHPEVKAQHRSLFYFLLEVFDHRGKLPRFQLNREDGMSGGAIGSKTTYYAVLKDLHDWGFIHYKAGKNGEQAAIIQVLPDKNTVPEVGHWVGRCWDAEWDAAGYAGGTTKKTYNLSTSPEREADASALALAEKKISELQEKIALLQDPQTAQPTSPPVAAPPPDAEPEPPLIPEPLAEGQSIPVFVDQRLPDEDPKKWVARPRDAQMVQDYIDAHSDPAVRARGRGKAHLFFEYYESIGWTVGTSQKPSTNWHYLIRSFHFRDPLTNGTPTTRSAPVAASSTVVTLASYGGNRKRPDAEPGPADAPAPARLGQ